MIGEWIRFWLCAALIFGGLFIAFSATYGVYKFDYALNRMHAAAMGDTLGLLLVLGGLAVRSGLTFDTLKLVMLVVMFWMASPVSSHLIARLVVSTDPELEKRLDIVPLDGKE